MIDFRSFCFSRGCCLCRMGVRGCFVVVFGVIRTGFMIGFRLVLQIFRRTC